MGGMEAQFGFNIRCVSCPGCGGALNRSARRGVNADPDLYEQPQQQQQRPEKMDGSHRRDGETKNERIRCSYTVEYSGNITAQVLFVMFQPFTASSGLFLQTHIQFILLVSA